MAQQTETHEQATDQLWSQLESGQVGMLTLPSSEQHPQPMTLYTDRDANAVWFITSSDTDLAVAIGSGGEGQLICISKSQDFHASIKGRLKFVRNESKLDELWSVPAAAWFENGRDDPTIRLLKFTPSEAAVWESQSNMILVGLRLLRAGLSDGDDDPKVGVHRILKLEQAA